jgi:hypothetical protein
LNKARESVNQMRKETQEAEDGVKKLKTEVENEEKK